VPPPVEPPPEDPPEPPPPEPPPTLSRGIWIDPDALAALRTTGKPWRALRDAADRPLPPFAVANQESTHNTSVLAKALVYARTGARIDLEDVIQGLRDLVTMGTYDGRALALGRNLGAYAIAADLVDLASVDPWLDAALRAKLRELRTTYTFGGPRSLIECHEMRPNNWGTHCGGARVAVAAYLDDQEDLRRAADVFRGFLGDRSRYSGFVYGGPPKDLSWQCISGATVGINPRGCTKEGRNIDGVIPDDQRRGGSFDADSWPPPRENYVWEALQGILMQAVILERAGYPTFEWSDRAILRAVTWLHEEQGYPAEGDDTWQPHVVNHFYGTSFPAPVPSRPGKNVGWTDWTHGP
jgi:hypothetical protein